MGKYELTIQEKELLALQERYGADILLKPLVREIHLFDTFIGGVIANSDRMALKAVSLGERLTLLRKSNKFNENEIEIYSSDGMKLGRIPEKDTVIFARLMDAGKSLYAKVSGCDVNRSVPVISIGIYLEDF